MVSLGMTTSKSSLYALIAPIGQLAGNGQLRESIQERRRACEQEAHFWYLSNELVIQFELAFEEGLEAVVAEELSVVVWQQLRFGGKIIPINLDLKELHEHASQLPLAPLQVKISIRNCSDNSCFGCPKRQLDIDIS